MDYSLHDIAKIIGAEAPGFSATIAHIYIDSRKSGIYTDSLFFALQGPRHDGHHFIKSLYEKGSRYFVTSTLFKTDAYPEAIFLKVPDTLVALQKLAARHREHFHYPVIGITGSNGKTIVKEWLWQALSDDFNIVRNPRSFNSQVGVPISVWAMDQQHELAIFEAGISLPGEMEKLQKIIQPTIGVITNIGEAHSSGFNSHLHKALEKIVLFKNADLVVHPSGDPIITEAMDSIFKNHPGPAKPAFFKWGKNTSDDLYITEIQKKKTSTHINAIYRNETLQVEIPFTDDASIENAITCMGLMLVLDIPAPMIHHKLNGVMPVDMRLQLKKGINDCTIINDSYSADISSLKLALEFLKQNAPANQRTVILSDFFGSKLQEELLYKQIAEDIGNYKISKLIGIGPAVTKNLPAHLKHFSDNLNTSFFESTDNFLDGFKDHQFKNETILVKGARIFEFEKIVKRLEEKVHQTVLEIDLKALATNVFTYKNRLPANVKVLAMVKAFAYGNGAGEIARVLQYNNVDYLGVAYVDEGIALRNAGIQLPMMVLNVDENAFDALVNYNLEPVVFSNKLLQSFNDYLQKQGLTGWPVHLEIESGMNRLGFTLEQLKSVTHILQQPGVKIQTIFSHLAASEDAAQDDFTAKQFSLFMEADSLISSMIGYPYLKHIANTAAVNRHPYLVLDMVRLGIGMYGIAGHEMNGMAIEAVATLKTTIAQVKHLEAGETVGYNRKGIISKPSVIATVRIGYADGYPRSLGNGKGFMLVDGKPAPVIGSVCMDMTMIDVTSIENVKEGDDVVVFGKDLSIQQLAQMAGTIPYEIMTGISERVPRVYFE